MLTISNAISNTSLKSALIPFVTAGYPTLKVTSKVLHLLDKQGVHAIELGIPYSDALADGILIQESSRIALEQKINFDQIVTLIHESSRSISAPIIIFTYLNPILSRGIDSFIREISDAGAKGLIVPDLPLEESDYFISICSFYNIELIFFISPASPEERVQEIILKAPGCIYVVSDYGVTGLRKSLGSNLYQLVQKIKKNTDKRIMLGFGISNEHQVSEIMQYNLKIDAIVMGSAFIKQIAYSHENDNYERLNIFCQNIKNSMK